MGTLYNTEHFGIDEFVAKFNGDDKRFIIYSKITGRSIVDKDGLLLKMTYRDCVVMIEQIEKIYHYFNE